MENNNQIKKRVAVILSVYKNDTEAFFTEAIDSLLHQTYTNFEVLIGVDGPVSGNMNDYLLTLEKNPLIRVIRFDVNRGLAAVLNDLLSICKKEGFDYYARMDADDKSVPDRLEKQVTFLDNHSEIDVLGGTIEEIDEKSNLKNKKVVYPLTHEECRKRFGYRNPMAHPAVMFRKTYFEKVEGYRNEYRKNQDTMLWLDGFLSGCQFANIAETVLYFRNDDKLIESRRRGWKYASDRLRNRWMVNRMMHCGIGPYLYAICMFFIRMSPAWVLKLLYNIR